MNHPKQCSTHNMEIAMKIISDWWARRAGGRITIHGVDDGGAPIKIVGVDKIESVKGGRPIATDKNGDRYELA